MGFSALQVRFFLLVLLLTGFSDVHGMRRSTVGKAAAHNRHDDSIKASKNYFSELDSDASDSDSNPPSNSTDNDSNDSDEDFVTIEYISTLKETMVKAWKVAKTVLDRSENIWRLDRFNNILLSHKLTRNSPLSFKALARPDVPKTANNFVTSMDGQEFGVEAVQAEYFGEGEESNHENALQYIPKDAAQDNLLSLIEIAMNGNVMGANGEFYCWVPSQIHRDLFVRDCNARRWHQSLYDYDPKYGKSGHILAFQHMGVYTKDVRNFSESYLDSLDQINTTMFITDFQPMCSAVIGDIDFVRDPIKTAEDIKNNWGLPRVTEFVDRRVAAAAAPARSFPIVGKKAVRKPFVAHEAYEKDYPALGLGSIKIVKKK